MIASVSKKDLGIAEALALFEDSVDLRVLSAICEQSDPDIANSLCNLDVAGLVETDAGRFRVQSMAKNLICRTMTQRRRANLSRKAFEILHSTGNGSRQLARFAFDGQLFLQCSNLSRKYANEALNTQNYTQAVFYLQQAGKCARRGAPPLSLREKADLAKSYKLSGKLREARRLYEEVLALRSDIQGCRVGFTCPYATVLHSRQYETLSAYSTSTNVHSVPPH